ncbi:YigZ family protein [bacterium]|nr:YigZ family protein [bacterium]
MEFLKETAIVKEKNSKFLGVLLSLKDIENIKEIIKTIKKGKRFSKGDHYIYAYKAGSKISKNDDGEKGAGKILVDLIRNSSLDNILILVIRWYGGKHLGSMRFKIIKNIALELLSNPI